ncbi:MAG TPA: sulfite reductase subunit A, partial [Candidatus Dormibacteraeota bacterium]|nr:sulfite reductase subunit A [Candidatus Dormibacteraeota bacterium]
MEQGTGTTTSAPSTETEREPRVLDEAGIELLIQALRDAGYEVVGPVLRDGAIVYDTLKTSRDLPRGVTDDQQAGRYRLEADSGDAWFGYSVGPQSWKRFLHPPTLTLWRARRDATGFEVEGTAPPPPRYALFGARACELAAIAVQDRVLTG